MRKLVTIRKIKDIKPIPGADRIELAIVDGWQVVTQKGQFKPGNDAIYFEIDSALPADDVRYAFLHKTCLREWSLDGVVFESCVRIKTTEFRGEISQGLLMPIDLFPELRGIPFDRPDLFADVLKVRHYDTVKRDADIKSGKIHMDQGAIGPRPSFVPDYDPDRLQNLPEYFDKYRYRQYDWEITEKFDGTACTVWYAPNERPDNPYGVSSKSIDLDITNPDNIYSAVARDIKDMVIQYGRSLAIYGELCGPGVNGNRDKYMGHVFRVWHIYDIDNREWLLPYERYRVCSDMGLKHVRIIEQHHCSFDKMNTMEDFLAFVDGPTFRGNPREGMVWKSVRDPGVSFKVINNRYLMKG